MSDCIKCRALQKFTTFQRVLQSVCQLLNTFLEERRLLSEKQHFWALLASKSKEQLLPTSKKATFWHPKLKKQSLLL
jgi:hypothetical protein